MIDGKNKMLLKEILLLIPNLAKLLLGMIKDRRVKVLEKIILLGTVLYVLSPLDFLPDFVPFMGKVDDLLLICLVVLRFLEQAEPQIVMDHWSGRRDLLELAKNALRLAQHFIPPNIYRKVVKCSGYRGDYIDAEYKLHPD